MDGRIGLSRAYATKFVIFLSADGDAVLLREYGTEKRVLALQHLECPSLEL